jgi:predicted nucleic acid-binding protein
MDSLVVDGSIALGFVLQDERGDSALRALDALENGIPGYVPAHWCAEVANGLLMAERRKRATHADLTEAFLLLQSLPIQTDNETSVHVFTSTIALARQYALTVYDAAYLELALRRQAVLATTDKALAKAARHAGVSVL